MRTTGLPSSYPAAPAVKPPVRIPSIWEKVTATTTENMASSARMICEEKRRKLIQRDHAIVWRIGAIMHGDGLTSLPHTATGWRRGG
uniref:Uncharacterized protein n=1 Tax=Oryza brachyantha TaxID=4533 RepID=J3MC49_ORYBR